MIYMTSKLPQTTARHPKNDQDTLFSETLLRFFSGGPKICNEIHSDLRDPPPFSENSSFLSPQNYRKNRNFLDRKWTSPPPLELFRKFIEFDPGSHPLDNTLNEQF